MVESSPSTTASQAVDSDLKSTGPEVAYPVSNQLITLVRKLNCFDESQLGTLKSMICSLTSQWKQREQSEVSNDSQPNQIDLEGAYCKNLLKMHQIFALLDVDYTKVKQLTAEHLRELTEQLRLNNGLQYCPREQSPQGRQFEHASDTQSLLKHLKTVEAVTNSPAIDADFQVSLTSDQENSDDSTVESDSATFVVKMKSSHFDLALRANGKAEIYFHSYFWTIYIDALAVASSQEDSEMLKSPEIVRMRNLSTRPQLVIDKIRSLPFGSEEYGRFVEAFGGRDKQIKKIQLIEELQRYLFVAQIYENKQSLKLIEKILVQLLGYQDMFVRDQAVVLLNMLYDGVDWQMQSAFRPIIRCVGQHFKVDLTIRYDNFQQNQDTIFIQLSAPSNLPSAHDTVLTWHKIMPHNIVNVTEYDVKISINFGKFWKCGFFDWRLILINNEGKLSTPFLTQPPSTNSFPITRLQRVSSSVDEPDDQDDDNLYAQGRFVVHAQGVRDHCFHEVQVDYQNAEVDFQNQTFARRGTFKDVERSLDAYKEQGVTALYLMGVFQRDNAEISNAYQRYGDQRVQYRKADASPLAVTDRMTPCKMLGGEQDFHQVVEKAKNQGIKIIVDCLARISSSRHHRKFKDLLLHYLDEDGRRRICYGTDGQARQYEDTAMLNYRKVEAWDLLVDEVLQFSKKTGVNGIHLDNGQAWPQILEPDLEELNRIDEDDQPAYSAMDLMNGEIVIRNENFGYWNTNTMEQQANPFFVKLCRAIWSQNPDFMILGECWGGFMFEHRQIILARSGVIPRLFKLPQTLCSMFGKRLHNDGRITECEKEPVTILKKWYEESRFCMPQGSIMMQSSTAHQWPYPAYLFGKGTWAAIDILHFLPDVPITFMNEVFGDVYRLSDSVSMHQAEKQSVKSGTGIKKSNSSMMLALSQGRQESERTEDEQQQEESKKPGGLGVKVRSGHNLNALAVEQQKAIQNAQIEQQFKQDIGSHQGYDLSKISTHYNHRRRIRKEKMVFRYGELDSLRCMNDEVKNEQGFVPNVLSFARYTLMETAIVATNLSDQTQKFWVDLQRLKNLLGQIYGANAVVMTFDLLAARPEETQEYFFLQEFLTIKHWQTLAPYTSSVIMVTVCQEDKYVFKKAFKSSIIRTKEKLENGLNIEAEQISQLLTDCLKNKSTDINYFSNLIGGLQEKFLDRINMNLNDLFLMNHSLKNSSLLSSRLMAFCSRIMEVSKQHEGDMQTQQLISTPLRSAKKVYESNQMGPIVFATPELGRWSTVGGLGVMVDELSLGLVKLGQEVIVISPYYDRNRKGVTGYLAQDPAGFEYVDNITVTVDCKITLGVHEGKVGGVKLVFLHHSEIFPSPYPDQTAANATRQLAVFGKACLEYLCKRQIIPSVCITNDWFTGFIPGYAKTGQFGPTFKGTSFMHICHNLQESYEGRIHPEPRDGGLEYIHGLPRDCLVDPAWTKVMLNPSRCAIMMSDNWSTVSKSYRDDLLNDSPLAPLLSMKEQPFAHPNGIPIAERIRKLDEKSPDHISAKRALQIKYFNYSELDDSVPLFAFVGRITQQKGVHLILDVAEHIIPYYQYKVQFLVGGPGNMNDPYSAQCAHRMWSLKQRYPNCFWAAPEEFFTDGALVNRGTDFGLMPSLFEPGGIVQHEFFVGCTPVIAFKTGGLKDSVIEFQWDSEVGCGFTFESYKKEDFIFAIERSIGTFRSPQKYSKLRQNAFNATMPGETVCKAWQQEFCRLRQKVFIDYKEMAATKALFSEWSPQMYSPINIVEQIIGTEKLNLYEMDDIDFGASESAQRFEGRIEPSEFDRVMKERSAHTFKLHNRGPRHQSVQICGSFDNWEKRHNMQFDHYANQWFTTLHLPKGEYSYKYVIDNQHWVTNEEEQNQKDKIGNVNNFVRIQ